MLISYANKKKVTVLDKNAIWGLFVENFKELKTKQAQETTTKKEYNRE